jgi:hypothetical protein
MPKTLESYLTPERSPWLTDHRSAIQVDQNSPSCAKEYEIAGMSWRCRTMEMG